MLLHCNTLPYDKLRMLFNVRAMTIPYELLSNHDIGSVL